LLRDLWARIPEVAHPPFEPVDRIAGGIRPLALTLSAALDALRQSLPVAREPATSNSQTRNTVWRDYAAVG
jgi:hypothetical protein